MCDRSRPRTKWASDTGTSICDNHFLRVRILAVDCALLDRDQALLNYSCLVVGRDDNTRRERKFCLRGPDRSARIEHEFASSSAIADRFQMAVVVISSVCLLC